MKNLPIVKDALWYVLGLGAFSMLLYQVFAPLSLIGIILTGFVLFFFRNPYRYIKKDDNIILSPADGKVISVIEIDEPVFLNSKAIKVTIFLSLLNVHINRSPVDGIVKFTAYRPGNFLPAFKSHASEVNERNTIGIEGRNGLRVLVHQITGFIARRIVCWVKEEDRLEIGERFGLIKFGSCTEIVLPTNVNVMVRQGDKVKAGKSLIGVVNW